jgi:hypothetical protein
MKRISKKFWDPKRFLSRRISTHKFIKREYKFLQKCYYPLKLRTILKQILVRNRYRRQTLTNLRKSRETQCSCTNQWSPSPRQVINVIFGRPESVCSSFWPRCGSAWDTLTTIIADLSLCLEIMMESIQSFRGWESRFVSVFPLCGRFRTLLCG